METHWVTSEAEDSFIFFATNDGENRLHRGEEMEWTSSLVVSDF